MTAANLFVFLLHFRQLSVELLLLHGQFVQQFLSVFDTRLLSVHQLFLQVAQQVLVARWRLIASACCRDVCRRWVTSKWCRGWSRFHRWTAAAAELLKLAAEVRHLLIAGLSRRFVLPAASSSSSCCSFLHQSHVRHQLASISFQPNELK